MAKPAPSSATFKERPLLFDTAMVRAILARGKSQTRRLLNPEPHYQAKPQLWAWSRPGQPELTATRIADLVRIIGEHPESSPLGRVGDRIWVRETWYQLQNTGQYLYRADCKDAESPPVIAPLGDVPRAVWKPSIFMPRAACRLELRITAVRVQFLQELTDEDAIAEGIYPVGDRWAWNDEGATFASPVDAYFDLWDRINPTNPWTADPIIVAITFQRLEAAHA